MTKQHEGVSGDDIIKIGEMVHEYCGKDMQRTAQGLMFAAAYVCIKGNLSMENFVSASADVFTKLQAGLDEAEQKETTDAE